MARLPPALAVALQGGGSHGAFTWGVLDKLLQEVVTDRLRISAISGSSAGAISGALTVSGGWSKPYAAFRAAIACGLASWPSIISAAGLRRSGCSDLGLRHL